jgi:hypothetical protein
MKSMLAQRTREIAMEKPIPTSVHGVLDYLAAASFVATPRLFGATKIGQRVMYGFAAATVLYSALTNYELGIWRVLPMKAHLVLDAGSGALLCGSAFMHKGMQSRAMLVGMGLFEIAAALLTQTHSSAERPKLVQRLTRLAPVRALRGAGDID